MVKNNTIWTVGEFTRQVKTLLETQLGELWVQGEVSGLRRQSSGHLYFTLKDKESQLPAVIFRTDALRQSVTLQDGLQIIVFGRVSVFEPRGAYQLIVRIVLQDGTGKLSAEFERLKQKLAAEGLFDSERKRPIPSLPKKIGFVTSSTGAAIRDFISVLRRRRWSGHLIVFPSLVQGQGASSAMIAMLQRAQTMGLDLLVIGRGGGSIEDLWAFNEEPLVREIARSTVPIISAVGHEIDYTLCDFAADIRAETPSAAAELISSQFLQCIERLQTASHALHRHIEHFSERLHSRLNLLKSQFYVLSGIHKIEQYHLRLDDLQNRLQGSEYRYLDECRRLLICLSTRLAECSPKNQCQMAKLQLAHLQKRFLLSVFQSLENKKNQLNRFHERLSSSHIETTLRRGFVLVEDERGELVTSCTSLQKGQQLINRFIDGKIVVELQKHLP